jgi:hypothetical protein
MGKKGHPDLKEDSIFETMEAYVLQASIWV